MVNTTLVLISGEITTSAVANNSIEPDNILDIGFNDSRSRPELIWKLSDKAETLQHAARRKII